MMRLLARLTRPRTARGWGNDISGTPAGLRTERDNGIPPVPTLTTSRQLLVPWLWRDYDPKKTSQDFTMDPAEKDKPYFRVNTLNRDAW
jgi:hypothetical protein